MSAEPSERRLAAPLAAALATLLTMTALTSVFATLGWWPRSAGIVVLMTAAATVVRSLTPFRLLPTVVAAAVGTCYVTAVFAPHQAVLGFVPSWATFGQIGAVAGEGFADVRDLAAPVPTHDGLVLLAVVGVGIVALAVDLAATGLRRPALAGLPLLALYVVPSASAPHGVGLVAFVLGAFGFLVLLGTDTRHRLRRWGRSLRPNPRQRAEAGVAVSPSPTGVAARRVGVTVIAAALVIPALLPSLTPKLGHHGSGPGAGHGGSHTTYNPFVAIKSQLTDPVAKPLLHYTASGGKPGYLRMTTLDRFNGKAWFSSPINTDDDSQVADGLPIPVHALNDSYQRSHVHVTVTGLDVPWLPVPFPTADVNVGGDWRYDQASGTIFSTEQHTTGIEYSVTARAGSPSRQALATAAEADGGKRYQHYTELPGKLPKVRALTKEVTSGADTPFAKARALQHFFRSPPFTYDQSSVPNSSGTHALARFLLKTHRGFCEQYSAAMATMARIAGIPARVAVGFTSGERQRDGSYVVTTHDAHAWPELYFAGIGWLRFEPTPTQAAGGTAVRPSYAPAPNQPGQSSAAPPQPGHQAGNAHSSKLQSLIRKGADTGLSEYTATTHAPAGSHGSPWPWVILGLALTALLVSAPAAGRLLSRARRAHRLGAAEATERAHLGWAQLRDDARDAGVAADGADTPRRFAARVAAERPVPAGTLCALRRLASAEERARYATAPPEISPATVRDDIAAVRAALLASVSRAGRLRATLCPPSMLHRLADVGDVLADGLDSLDQWVTRAPAWLRGRLAPRRAS